MASEIHLPDMIDGDGRTIDARVIKKRVLQLERRIAANLEARLKYIDTPDRFMDSEIALDNEIKSMQVTNMEMTADGDVYSRE